MVSPGRVPSPAARWLVAGALLATTAAACAPAATDDGSAAPEVVPVAERLVRGTIVPGATLRFRSCDQSGDLPLRPVDLFIRNLLDEMTVAGEPLYAEFMGRVGGRVPTMTFARLVHATRESRGCAGPVPAFEFRAHGNEPFWSVEVRDGTAVWTTPEVLEGVAFAITSREQVGNGWLFAARQDGNTSLGISFAGTPCRDSMADAWFGYTVQLARDEVEYRGCGREGGG